MKREGDGPFYPTFDHEYGDKVSIKISMPKGWKPGECSICYFKPLASRCRFFKAEHCPLKVKK